ncbi:hypothetical protein TRVA0_002S03092 [Trichomonascus vanleenenianus]|uniref:Sec39p n=1 Tax=Trichomonascus vanleenenianus TaxID=2268995 RepID=UPI003ECA94C7
MDLIEATQAASQGDVAKFASVVTNNKDLFLDGDVFAANSALSIVLALFPECKFLDAGFIHDLWAKEETLNNWVLLAEASDATSDATSLYPQAEIDSRSDAIKQFIEKRTASLGWTREDGESEESTYAKWVKIRTRLVDSFCGDFDDSVMERKDTPKELADWFEGTACVVAKYRLHNQDNPGSPELTIEQLEKADPVETVETLLAASKPLTIARDFETLALPYAAYTDSYSALAHWIGSKSLELDFLQPISRNVKLDEGQDVKILRPILAACYNCSCSDESTNQSLNRINLALQKKSFKNSSGGSSLLESIKETDLESFDSLLASPLTELTQQSLALFSKFIQAIDLLSTLSLPQLARISLFGSADNQFHLIQQYITLSTEKWDTRYGNIEFQLEHICHKADRSKVLACVLRSALKSAAFDFVKQNFEIPPSSDYEEIVLDEFNEFFDKATNGNKARGSMKHAQQCLDLLSEPLSAKAEQARALLEATDNLSRFSLTLTPGVPLKPADIKLHGDPLDIVHRVLEMNPAGYKQLNELVEIAQQLFFGLTGDYEPSYTTVDTVEIKVRAMCAESALVNDDFATAYKYCMPALATLKNSQVAWTACYQVGRYISPTWTSISSKVLSDKSLILTHTLDICPKENITGVLSAWRNVEAQLSESTDRRTEKQEIKRLSPSPGSAGSKESSPPINQQRRRDQISNLLVSGLGWAIGANSTPTQ